MKKRPSRSVLVSTSATRRLSPSAQLPRRVTGEPLAAHATSPVQPNRHRCAPVPYPWRLCTGCRPARLPSTHLHGPSPYARRIIAASPGSCCRSRSRVLIPAVTSVRMVASNQAW